MNEQLGILNTRGEVVQWPRLDMMGQPFDPTKPNFVRYPVGVHWFVVAPVGWVAQGQVVQVEDPDGGISLWPLGRTLDDPTD